jgi:hypothetical protein
MNSIIANNKTGTKQFARRRRIQRDRKLQLHVHTNLSAASSRIATKLRTLRRRRMWSSRDRHPHLHHNKPRHNDSSMRIANRMGTIASTSIRKIERRSTCSRECHAETRKTRSKDSYLGRNWNCAGLQRQTFLCSTYYSSLLRELRVSA